MLLPQPLPPMMMKMSLRLHGEVEVVHQHEAAERHGQVAHHDVRLRRGAVRGLRRRASGVGVPSDAQDVEDDGEAPQAQTIRTMPVTTAEVAASPTAEALLPHLHAAQAAGDGDQHAVDRGLEDAADEVADAAPRGRRWLK